MCIVFFVYYLWLSQIIGGCGRAAWKLILRAIIKKFNERGNGNDSPTCARFQLSQNPVTLNNLIYIFIAFSEISFKLL